MMAIAKFPKKMDARVHAATCLAHDAAHGANIQIDLRRLSPSQNEPVSELNRFSSYNFSNGKRKRIVSSSGSLRCPVEASAEIGMETIDTGGSFNVDRNPAAFFRNLSR
jgi:hypothetical protein